ncbi:MAG: hypothetical protein WC867_05860 [Candidatus Pacearchaeota archaeon]|jgi:tetratricopeptide (TPR) repeat protein
MIPIAVNEVINSERRYLLNLAKDVEENNLKQDPIEIRKYLPSIISDASRKRRTEFRDTYHEFLVGLSPIENSFVAFDGFNGFKNDYIKFSLEKLLLKQTPNDIILAMDMEFMKNSSIGACLKYCAILAGEEFVKYCYFRDKKNILSPAEKLLSNANKKFYEGDFDEAKKLIEECLKKSPEYISPYVNKAHILRAEGDLEGSVSASNDALKISSRSKFVWYQLANSLLQLGKKIDAYDSIKIALDIDPDFVEAIELFKEIKE